MYTEDHYRKGNNVIAEFMPNMMWIIPKNTAYGPYWRKINHEGLPLKDYEAGHTLTYHQDWNALKKVIDYIFTFSLAYPEETFPVRSMRIVVDILPAWEACVTFAQWHKKEFPSLHKTY